MNIKNVSFFLTDRCSASCSVCCFQCSPSGKFVQDPEVIRRFMKQAAEFGTVESFCFTGGEPLLYPKLVTELGGYGFHEFGIPFMLVSNGFWGANPDSARTLIRELADAGMKEIRISADLWHQQYVPAESVRTALRVINEAGIVPSMSIMETKDRRVIAKTVEALRPEIYSCDDIIYYPLVLPEATGRREEISLTEEDVLQTFPLEQLSCYGLNSVELFWDGYFYPCCSQFSFEIPRLRLGHYTEASLEEIRNRLNRDPLLEIMARHGLGWFVSQAKEHGICLKDRYSMSCEFCRDILNHTELLPALEEAAEKEAQRARVEQFLGVARGSLSSKETEP